MSYMEVFIGSFELADDQTINPVDDDDFYEKEIRDNCLYVKVFGKVYKFWSLVDVDRYGFSVCLPPSQNPTVVCYWYNGGASVHEVVRAAIMKHVKAGVK